MLSSRWSPLVLWFSNLPVSLLVFGDCSKWTNYNWYHHYIHNFLALKLDPGIYHSSRFLLILLCDLSGWQIHNLLCPLFFLLFFFFFFLTIARPGRLVEIRQSGFFSKIPENYVCLILQDVLLLLLFYFERFFLHQHQARVFHWSLSDSKSPQVPRTLLSMLSDLTNEVILTVSGCVHFF